VEFDLLFAAVKQKQSAGGESKYDIDGHAKLLEKMNEFTMKPEDLATHTALKGVLKAVNNIQYLLFFNNIKGYQQNIAINDVLAKNKRNFRITVAAIKHWAKRKF
jgi:hypothetical protein